MSSDELTKLFTYMTERFDRTDKPLENKAEKIECILGTLDTFVKRQEINDDERLALGCQLGQPNNHQLANKIGKELSA
jgi:hypothetical protein